VLISGGKDKLIAIRATIRTIRPTTLITDERTAVALLS
jgi:DNA-binding transcriptional regulator LsrR (DeoR family)